jgi:glycerate dehydrogenase
MKITILDGHALNPGDLSWDQIAQFGEVRYYDRTESEALTIERIGDSEIILLNKVPISRNVLDHCPNLKLICVLATGYNVVDYKAAAEKGIAVCNVPGYSTDSVAQFTFALLLELCHQVGLHSQSVHSGDWCICPDFCYWKTPQMELAGKTIGIIGYGAIGQAVGKIAKAFGMKVLAHSRTRYPEHSYVDLDTLLAESDVITLHCPLFPENTGMINRLSIAKMKDGAFLLNTARGGLVDEAAVAAALENGKLGGYAADVAITEPIPAGSPLLGAKNCILTPHMAWAPVEARQRILNITEENIRSFLAGNGQNVINLP